MSVPTFSPLSASFFSHPVIFRAQIKYKKLVSQAIHRRVRRILELKFLRRTMGLLVVAILNTLDDGNG